MGWWSRAKSAVKSAVNKAVSAVKKVATTVKKTVTKVVKKVSSAVKKVSSSVKKKVSSAVKKVSSSVKKVVTTIKNAVGKFVDDVSDKVEGIKDTIKDKVSGAIDSVKDKVGDVKDTISEKIEEAVEKAKEKIKSLNWWERVKAFFKERGFFTTEDEWKKIEADTIKRLGKLPEETTWEKINMTFLEYLGGLNALSRLFTGKNLKGEPEKFKPVADSFDLIFTLIPFMTVAKFGKVGVKLGSKGFIRLFTTKSASAIKLFKRLNVDDQAKMLRGLLKTDEGVGIINKLLSKKALRVTLVKPTISLVNKKITEKILVGAGFGAFIRQTFKLKTIMFGLGGMVGLLGLAYGIPFGTSWLAKEGIKEQFEIPLSDRMRDFRYEPTPEKLEIIRDDIKKLRAALPIAKETIMRIAWLWPPTREAWEFYAENIYFSIDQYEREIELIIVPELIVLPEEVRAIVRDIIDGDTIDVDLTAKNKETGEEIKLPEYAKTGHARIRIVGINAPEKSPKGEILCSDVEIYEVEKEFADKSRDRLLYLNDKEVILKIDPEIRVDTHNRILAVVEYGGVDIGLRQIEEGLACGYYREPHKYFDEDEYSAATLDAKDEGIGMWRGLEEVEKEEDKIKIRITSMPTNAKLFLDDISLHHNTPSDERELSDVMYLFTLGDHVLSAEKAGLSAMVDIKIVPGDNGTIHLDLVTEPIEEEPTEEEIEEEELEEELEEEEVEEEEIVEPVPGAVKMDEIPTEYTSEQEWALKEAFRKILILTEGKAIISGKEREDLINSFAMYTDGQKEVLELLWRDLFFYTEGRKQLSADEYIALKEKYRMI